MCLSSQLVDSFDLAASTYAAKLLYFSHLSLTYYTKTSTSILTTAFKQSPECMWWILTFKSNFILIVQRIMYTQVKCTFTPFSLQLRYTDC